MAINFKLSIGVLLFAGAFFCRPCSAEFEVPKNWLSAENRRPVLEVLGTASQLKLMGDPFPLGGYLGFDFGLSRDAIGIRNLNELEAGSRLSSSDELGLWSITMGKGLYYNLDVFLQFIPFGSSDRISSFGGGGRWMFYEMKRAPIFYSFQFAVNSVSFQNLINFSNQNLDFLVSVANGNLTFFTGLGYLKSTGIFLGGVNGVTKGCSPSPCSTVTEYLSSGKMLVGVSYRLDKYYLSTQVDKAIATNYSIKLGYRF